MRTDEIQIKHQFDDRELATMGREQAEKIERVSTLELELDSVKKQYNSQIAEAKAAISRISSKVFSGWEMRPVRVLMLDERPDGYRLLVRLDNGHIARRRKLEANERQMELQDGETPQVPTAVALLDVDDENWDVEHWQVPLFKEEAEALKSVEGLRTLSWVEGMEKVLPLPTDSTTPDWRASDERKFPRYFPLNGDVLPADAPDWVKPKAKKGK